MVPLDFDLYLVTDRRATAGRTLLDALEGALSGGVRAIELREKDLDEDALARIASEVRALASRFGARMLVNGGVEVARLVGAGGVHLTASRVSRAAIAEARGSLGPGSLVGASSHGLEEAILAERAGADFVTCGPVFFTPSKAPYGPPVGLETLAAVARSVRIPVFAIGGVTEANLEEAIAAGAHGIACIREILGAPDPRAKASALLARIGRSKRGGWDASR